MGRLAFGVRRVDERAPGLRLDGGFYPESPARIATRSVAGGDYRLSLGF